MRKIGDKPCVFFLFPYFDHNIKVINKIQYLTTNIFLGWWLAFAQYGFCWPRIGSLMHCITNTCIDFVCVTQCSVLHPLYVIQLVMGMTRLGFMTTYLSDPLVSGFTTGAACHVFTSQIRHVFGVTTGRYSGAFKLIYVSN